MPVFVAVDAGGTSTRAVVLDGSGTCLGYGLAGGGNPLSSGPDVAAASLATAVAEAIAQAGVDPASAASATVAMAGASTHLRGGGPQADVFRAALAACGVHAPLVVESDLLAMFCAATASVDGYAIVAGTGAAGVRVRASRVTAVADGMGWLLGDEGAGFWFGRAVARAVVADLDGRGPRTALTPALLATLGPDASPAPTSDEGVGAFRAPELHAMLDAVHARRPVELARYAPLAFGAPDDAVAAQIVAEGSAALGRTLRSVLDDAVVGPLALGGSVLLRQDVVARAVEEAWRAAGRTDEVLRVAEGTAGAAVLALRNGGAVVDAAVLARITDSLAALRPPHPR